MCLCRSLLLLSSRRRHLWKFLPYMKSLTKVDGTYRPEWEESESIAMLAEGLRQNFVLNDVSGTESGRTEISKKNQQLVHLRMHLNRRGRRLRAGWRSNVPRRLLHQHLAERADRGALRGASSGAL